MNSSKPKNFAYKKEDSTMKILKTASQIENM
jgi:hypothetical protein